MRALIDTAVLVSLQSKKEYNKCLIDRGWMSRPDIEITQADGNPMRIKGMVKLPLRVGGTQDVQKFYVTADLCGVVILGEDWLHYHRSKIKFNPTILIVNGMDTLLGSSPDRSITVVAEDYIKLPPRTAVLDRSRLVIGENAKKEVALCETVVDAAEIMPIILANQSHRTIKKGEVGRALPLRTIQ